MTTLDAARSDERTGTVLGTVEGIFVAATGGAPMRGVESVVAVEGRGLEGDRYEDGLGTYSSLPGGGRHVTLIAAEALEALEREHGIKLDDGASRRNVVTRGLDPLGLVGKRFWVGDALLEGLRDCPPCSHLARLTGQRGVVKGLARTGGLRAEVRQGGTIRLGDAIQLAD